MGSEAIAEEGTRKGDFLAGKYLLEDCLGIGGMGEVYRATNVSLDRKVAIKLLNADFAKNEDDVLRFLREARAAAAVRHPNVVDVIDVAREDDGTPFIVQELLSGEDLEQYLHNSGGRLPADAILEIMIPVADAIAAAHAKNVIHRDLKPANIFLAREGTRIVPKVLDFGACLYKTVGSQSSKEARMLIGTPHYMAPEQVVADKELDARADVWAIGVIMYELLVGETPFEAESVSDVLKLVRTRRIPSISKLLPDTPHELRDVATRCLSRVRAERYIDASELHDALVQARDAIRGPIQELPPQSRRRVDSRAEIDSSEVRTKVPAEPAVSSTPSLMLGPKANAKKGPTKRRGAALLTLSMPDEDVPSSHGAAARQRHPAFGNELDFGAPPPSTGPGPTSVERPIAQAEKAWPFDAAPSSPLALDSDRNLAALDLDIGPRVPSSLPPVLNPRSALGAPYPSSPMPMPAVPPSLQRPSSGASFRAVDPAAFGPPSSHAAPRPSYTSQSSMQAQMPRPSSSMEAVRISQVGLAPHRITPQRATVSAIDTLAAVGLSIGIGVAGFVALSFLRALTVPIGHALRGESIIGCALLTVVVLVGAVVIAVRAASTRALGTIIASVGAGIFGILMIAVTFGASEAAELGIPSAAAALVPFIAPIAPFALVTTLVMRAREDWRDERAVAFRSIAIAAMLVVAALAGSPIGAVRAAARAPLSTGR